MPRAGHPRRQWRGPFVCTATVLSIIAAVPSTSWAGFSAQDVDAANRFSAGTLQLEAQATSTCYSTGSGSGGTVDANTAQCTGSPLPTGQLTTGSVLTATSTLSNAGTTSPRAASTALLSCGAAEVSDSSNAGNTGLIYGGVSYGVAFSSPANPGFTSTGIGLTGASGTYVGTTASLLAPLTFTLVAWVKTTASTGGGIIGFSNVQPDVRPGSEDRMVWVEPTGQVAFGVQTRLTMSEVTSSTTVNDGRWHFVAATLTSSTLSLDVDGTTTNVSISFPLSYTGYWHLGWAGNSAWPNGGSDEYLAGSLFGVGVYPPLSGAGLATLNDASSASAYAAATRALSPSADWLLSDGGTTPYTGAIPVLGATPLCQEVLIDLQESQGSTVTCIYPSSSGTCPTTPPAGAPLSALGTAAMDTVTPGLPVSVLVRMTLATSSIAGVLGLHLLPDLGFTTSLDGWTAEVTYPSASLEM